MPAVNRPHKDEEESRWLIYRLMRVLKKYTGNKQVGFDFGRQVTTKKKTPLAGKKVFC
jgi:hypothetical protein